MAYAYCPKCAKYFRYSASADAGPVWLRDLAKSLGRGEPPVFLCYRCWVLPEVGDIVVVIDPPGNVPPMRRGARGRVTEVLTEPLGGKRFVVEALGESEVSASRCALTWAQVQAAALPRDGTVRLSLAGRPR